MAVQYITYQDNRSNGNGKWYGRVITPATLNLEAMAKRIERSCSMTHGDVLGVLTELVEVMNNHITNGNKVKLPGVGTFYVNIRSKGAQSEEVFKGANIKGVAVKFLAEGKKVNGNMTRAFTDGITYIRAK